jgi:hypothetical protein
MNKLNIRQLLILLVFNNRGEVLYGIKPNKGYPSTLGFPNENRFVIMFVNYQYLRRVRDNPSYPKNFEIWFETNLF